MKRQGNILLYPISLVYGAITSFRNFLYNFGILNSHEFNVPVICVGNITVGGTGKTPHSEYLINLLRDKFKIVLLSRGYGRTTKGFLEVKPGMSPSQTGDEPLQICRKFPDIIVAVDRKRVRGIKTILDQYPSTEVIVLDDAYQHRSLKPGFSILLSDFDRLIIHDHILPYGNLRESIRNKSRADVILITKSPVGLPAIQRRIIAMEFNKSAWQNIYFTSLSHGDPIPVFQSGKSGSAFFNRENRNKTGILLVTGIARADILKDWCSEFASELVHLAYRDHHNFSSADINEMIESYKSLSSECRYIITTEKDAMRLKDTGNFPDQIASSFFYIPAHVVFLNDDQNEFDNLIIDYVRKNKRNN